MEPSELERALLELVSAPGYRPAKPRALAKQLRLSEDDERQLKRSLKRLVKQGKLTYGANHLVGAAEPDSPGYRVTGVFRRAGGGFGFVRPAGSAPGADRKHDIYIPARDTLDAATGDTVLVRLRKRSGVRGNPEGEVVEIIERETHQFVGTYFEAGGSAYVQVDGGTFSQPINVGDPGAKSAQPDDKVVIEMVRFPSQVHDGEGVILEVLGPRGRPGVDTLSIIREFNLPDQFAEDALEAARDQAEAFDESIPPGRDDLTHLTVITIDPVDARDFDDAISLEQNEAGHWVLGVHIADVSHFVKPHTPLDREAQQRGTSVYLPDRVLPMLPELISNGLASLQPERVRYTKSLMIEMTADGVVVGVDAHSAAIRSRRRFTYEEVDDFLANRAAWQSRLTPEVHALLGRMHSLAMLLRQRRFRRGALELSMNEVKIDLDRNGQVTGAHFVVNTESHQIIEEFMLSANEAVAQLLAEHQLNFLRRVHQAPDPHKLKVLTEFVNGVGIACDSLESRFELQKLLKQVAGKPQEHAVNYATLRSLQRAVYSPEEEGHYALASDCYAHFTSPIRRYPDLTIHRLLEAVIDGRKPRQDFGHLAVLGEHCSDRERRAEAAERELVRVKLLNYLSSRLGQKMKAVVTGVEEFGLFVQGIELPAEGLVHVTSLADDYYRFDRAAHTLAGHRSGNTFRLGDLVDVAVARVDVDRRELDFRLVGRGERPSPKSAAGRRQREELRSSKKVRKKRERRQKAKRRKGR
jgi:ribonuclease R